MPYCVQELSRRNLTFPVIIGGAAINRKYGYRTLFLEDRTPYPGGVYYARDAFEGLDLVEALMAPEKREELHAAVLAKALAQRDAPEKPEPVAAPGARSAVKPVERPPAPPFWGPRVVPPGEVRLQDVWPHLDLIELYKLQWGVRSKDKAEYERLVREEFEPKLEALKGEILANGWLTPRIVYGYFPCHAEGNDLVVLDPERRKEPLCRIAFPRQPDERQLCLADYFRAEPGSDVVAFQVVTVGPEATRLADAWQEKGDYSRALFLHGLAVETAEALAEYWHRVVRGELGIPAEQGKRYSPGYPSWPELVDQRQIWRLLDPARTIGVSLTTADQMVPEQSTSAIVLHHPEAIYYTIRGVSSAAGA
jgi:5-methyltetrahydrofolate--homocysteine methyltransferase